MSKTIRSFFSIALTLLCAAFCSQALATSPKAGIWWNPNESGRGYSIDVSGNTLVMAVYAYNSAGTAQWYVTAGPLTNNGTQWQGTLSKYTNGPCLGCAFVSNQANGNDGTISITFTSDTSGTLTMPNGATTTIQTFFQPVVSDTTGGLPLQFSGFSLEKLESKPYSFSCGISLTAKNTNTTAKTGSFYFDVVKDNAVVQQLTYIFQSLGAGQTGVQTATTFASPTGCSGFSIQFNAAASKVF